MERQEAGEEAITPPGPEPPPAAKIASGSAPGAVAPQAGNLWREEISSRVERFRKRRRIQATLPLDFGAPPEPPPVEPWPPAPQFRSDASRKVIPFQEIAAVRWVPPEPVALPGKPVWPQPEGSEPLETAARPRPEAAPWSPTARTRRPRITIPSWSQPSLAFPEPPPPPPLESVDFPVAPLAARVMAAAADAALLACGYALFFAAYTFLGGKFPIQRTALAVLASSLALLAFLYVFLFLYYAAATPGMRWMNLQLVDFDGLPARRDQRTLRLLGLLASGAALGFGFLWAAVDEDGLTWHDRISRTCLTMEDFARRKRLPGR